MNKNIVIVLIILIVIIGGIWLVFRQPADNQQEDIKQGMKIEILQQGAGPEAKSGDTVTVNYTGTLVDGTKFDSSLNPGRTPFQFTIGKGQVIQGWEQGLIGMKVEIGRAHV